MSTIHVAPRGARLPSAPDRRPMTRLAGRIHKATFRRPSSEPGGATRLEMWAAQSACRRWRYIRQDDGATTPWTVTYRPTGQTQDWYSTLSGARRDTGPEGELLRRLRGRAFVAAFRGPAEGRVEGHRLLAIHMRLLGQDEADYRCQCGGLLVAATRDGQMLAHLDACGKCWTYGAGFDIDDDCPTASEHRFCGSPRAVECGHRDRMICGELARPNWGVQCGGRGDVDCCTACCNGE